MKIKMMDLSFYIAFIVSVLLFLFLVYMKNNVSVEKIENQYVQIELVTNDTIWEIADKYVNQHSLSYTEFINWVEKHNQIDADDVRAGLKIWIPIKKLENNEHDTFIAVGD